jgi:hypothetical protein
MAGDMNSRICNSAVPKLIGPCGETAINANGRQTERLFCINNLRIANILYRHKEINRCPWAERGTRSITDHIIANEKLWPYIQDTEAIEVQKQIRIIVQYAPK